MREVSGKKKFTWSRYRGEAGLDACHCFCHGLLMTIMSQPCQPRNGRSHIAAQISRLADVGSSGILATMGSEGNKRPVCHALLALPADCAVYLAPIQHPLSTTDPYLSATLRAPGDGFPLLHAWCSPGGTFLHASRTSPVVLLNLAEHKIPGGADKSHVT